MKIFNASQIRDWDAFTIDREPVSSLELMNRAAGVFTDWFTRLYPDTQRPVIVLAGTGNNGGDGVAVARLLYRRFFAPKVLVCDFSGRHSADFDAQIADLPADQAVPVQWLDPAGEWPDLPAGAVVIEALFGTGLSRPLEGKWAEAVEWINRLPNEVVSIDLPAGLSADAHTGGACVRADLCFSFQQPKKAFFFPENSAFAGEWTFGDIGLSPEYAAQTPTDFYYLDEVEARNLVLPRPKFSHKGAYGHALLVAGSRGKTGAAVLAARAVLRAGAGLLTVHCPARSLDVLQSTVPEAMCTADSSADCWSDFLSPEHYAAVGVGPGIGTDRLTADALEQLLQKTNRPLVLDADALNLLAAHPEWWPLVPQNSILTPHPKEFERLFGPSTDDFARNDRQRARAIERRVIVVLKGAHTAIASPDGACWFNSTGNPGMATGGSGDVLTGLLTGLLASGYLPAQAARLGVFLHGLAGDLAARQKSMPGMTAGDLVEAIPTAWLFLTNSQTL